LLLSRESLYEDDEFDLHQRQLAALLVSKVWYFTIFHITRFKKQLLFFFFNLIPSPSVLLLLYHMVKEEGKGREWSVEVNNVKLSKVYFLICKSFKKLYQCQSFSECTIRTENNLV
jgi:hypothetical protein